MYYAHVCPDTRRVFLCETGVDNNLAEVFARNDKENAYVAARILALALNEYEEKHRDSATVALV